MTDDLWIGDSGDESHADLGFWKVRAILNVAQDMPPTRGWPDVEYSHVGLIDGPGNSLAAYHAAVLVLEALLKRGRTLVCCHTGGRALAVALMHLHLTGGRGWDERLALLRERADRDLLDPHEAHKTAFNKMNWRLLASATGIE